MKRIFSAATLAAVLAALTLLSPGAASWAAPPPPPGAPIISGAPAGTISSGSYFSFTPSALDPDGNALTFTIANKPSWATFSTVTGMLSGTPTAGTYSGIQISVSDGTYLTALPAFSLSVAAAGATPVPVLEGWWSMAGVLAGIGFIACRRKAS